MTKDIAPEITQAWNRFVSGAAIDDGIVRAEVAASWQRCSAASVNPYHNGVSHLLLDQRQLEDLRSKKRNLLQIARLFMANLYRFVAGSGFIVMLSDEHGYIMEVIGDRETMTVATQLNLSQGASWVEEEVGTNGIGTALATQKPVQISGAEHYCQKVHFWTCSAAPILDSQGKIMGILQMSGPNWKTHEHTLGMVVAAVEAIKNQLRLHLRNRDLSLLNNRLKNVILTVSEGIIVIDKRGMIEQINPIAETIFCQPEAKIKGNSIEDYLGESVSVREMLARGKSFKDSEVVTYTSKGSTNCLSSGKPIRDDKGDFSGGVIFINPIPQNKHYVNRGSGEPAAFEFAAIIGESKELQKGIKLAKIAAASKSHVLLQGESGTGKEVFAQAIHNSSSRRNGPFVAINCGAIPRELIGSELFGYEGGSFTGAKSGGRAGKFELASGGTLFLDEIGDMPLEQQVSLLRVLQDKHVMKIGGYQSVPVDVRIICATNKNLREEVRKGTFRQDLFFRLNVINIFLPPLRERREDIPLLFRSFYKEICPRLGVDLLPVDSRVVSYLSQYNWPGNVRELQNVIERMVNLAQGQGIRPELLPDEILFPDPSASQPERERFSDSAMSLKALQKVNTLSTDQDKLSIKKLLAKNERQEIIDKLLTYQGNISHTAKEMGISRNSLYKKLKKLDITVR
ncbi:sigma-54-dependent Fis family transcriptional regulator [Desulfosporosinus sp. FKA]|uniref:sigma-54-dependent Fis family transcriptional regulator n=1 Tax=Desulfosporosinus sp. FKA TaxID=1969834 RepID=UPI000B49F331|nr:sigma-54-dependent Fis family transcriptional regulator [Desulfosporosinus sp. FKA]